ncbi:type II secretion system F family protein [Streptomyces sp. SL13]|uniref:Type II secretion system F family protein n=1 Tax=Streptantibioticus silvisoli TaxID=2705255 RepID=A0AA90HE25_9ACTN|nr:type II secretion system F family protein [Streptantibioticus silvisoli]MDI5974030.1 type II secretion system F family protein [Streptantibioticus silvisoli]
MITIVLGALFGGGLIAVVLGARSTHPPLAAVLAALHRPPSRPRQSPAEAEDAGGWASRWGRHGVPVLRAAGLPTVSSRADLAIMGVVAERHLAEKAASAAVGLVGPPVLILLAEAVAGAAPGWWLPAWSAPVFGAALFVAPDLSLRAQAARRRAEMRHALAVFLDLVVVALAGGAGVEQALTDAGTAPQGWAASRIRRALATAQLARTSVWEELATLGRQTGVDELVELSATVDLAGAEGARIRRSLESKAAAMRGRRLAEADGAAQAATERMSLPVVLLFSAFLLFIGYPAMAHVLTGL